VNGKLEISHFQISHFLIDVVIPLILAAQNMTLEQRRAVREFERQEEEKRKREQITEVMMENLPTYMNPVSYSMQGCRTSLLDRKMQQIQMAWDRLSQRGRRPVFRKGLTQGNSPVN
jgi:hypothetical protein